MGKEMCSRCTEGEKTYPGGDGEEGEGNDGMYCISNDAICVSGVCPLISQEAETYKPQERPGPCSKQKRS